MNTCEVFDLTNRCKGWTVLPQKLSIPRRDLASSHLDGRLFAVGGFHRFTPVATVEVLDTNRMDADWCSLPQMHHT
ncbi:unnamed protein product [Protopolystoma xenopodis]|uniref:Kelch repeat protein n=1 Tax=Protopolystoma xenopodis TaxID=117903 RepID=A0A448WHG7_9PLAT|nr:unnamed protein product [Protopolystoma xenopodis]